MDIFDVFTEDELDELPDDPQVAFQQIARKASGVLRERTEELLQSNDESDWRTVQEERHGFLNLIVASGRRLGIGPFQDYQVPQVQPFGGADWQEFKSELDHYMTQMALDNSIRGKRDSVELPAESKEKIRSYLHELKVLIDKSDLTAAKKAKLHEKLADFEALLEKKRLNLLAVTLVGMAFLGLAPDALGSYDIVAKLISNVMHEVAEAKAVEDDTRELPPREEPALLMPPRKPEPEFRKPSRMKPSVPAFDSGGTDDDIPF